jgi:5-methylcytosine-specific restriction endonuclease McrA
MKKASKYPPNWKEIRSYIKQRDNNVCQHCNANQGDLRTSRSGSVYETHLSVAHLDHDAENWNVEMDRLLLLCQPCHLKYDKKSNLVKSQIASAHSQKIRVKKEKTNNENDLKRIIVEQERIIDRIMGGGYVPSGSLVLEKNDSATSLTKKLRAIGIRKNRQNLIELALLITSKLI